MAQETNQSHQGPMLCSTGCGFYSNPRNNGMCSVCYKDFLQRQNNSGRVSPPGASSTDTSVGESLLAQCSDSATVMSPAAAASPAHTQSAHCSGPASASGTSEEDTTSGAAGSLTAVDLSASSSAVPEDPPVQSEDKPKAKKNRCFTCRKKVGLTGFDCRCGNVFCCMHRYSDVHSCTFNYKADAAEKIRKENPVIVGEKIQKI